MRTERSAVYGKVSRWRVRWVDGTGAERTKSFQRKPDAQAYLNGLTADLHRGEYVDPRKSAETFGSVAEQWFATKQHRKPKTVAGYRSLLDTVVLPTWADVPLKRIDYESYSTWLGDCRSTVGSGERACRLVGSFRRISWSELSSSTRNALAESQRTWRTKSSGMKICPSRSSVNAGT